MRITLEADYALRMVCQMAKSNRIMDANFLSESTAVPKRFSLKILRKLTLGDLVRSYKGANGGYTLSRSPKEISLKDVLELIDGPVAISRCISDDSPCSVNGDGKFDCKMHHVFSALSDDVSRKMSLVSIYDMVCDGVSVNDLIDKLKF